MKTIALAGTFDTKGEEYLYVKGLVEELGMKAFMIHTGVFDPAFPVDVTNQELARVAGYDIEAIAAKKDRALATEVLSQGMEILLPELFEKGYFDGILSFGGSGGTSMVTPAMRKLPVGVPKVMVSTMASGNVEQYVGTSDIVMMPSIVDVAGLNKISRLIFRNAVSAVAGMVNMQDNLKPDTAEMKPLVAATMFGVTTTCISIAKAYLEARGYEVLVFHATGTGGKTMEHLIAAGFFKGVLDLTTTEWCDEVVGGVLAAGPARCEAAAMHNVPQVVSVGALDMVNFGPYETVPPQFAGRNLYKHNPTVTLMRTTSDELKTITEKIVGKMNMATGKTAVMLPLKGVSAIDAPGQPFFGPDEDNVIFDIIRRELNQETAELIEMDYNINDKEFAEAAAQKLIDLMEDQK